MTKAKTISCNLFGNESLVISCAEILINRGHQINNIVTENPLIVDWAVENKINVLGFNENLIERLKQKPCDYIFSITNLRLLSEDIIQLPKIGAINFHDSLLPKYAGLNATTWAILNEEKKHGITFHYIIKGIDEGDIIKQMPVSIAPGETAFTLNIKCFEAGRIAFGELLSDIENDTIKPVKQNLNEKTYFSKYKKPTPACFIDWKQPAGKIQAFFNSLITGNYDNPVGLPKIRIKNKYFIVKDLAVLKETAVHPAGIISSFSGDKLFVSSLTNLVEIKIAEINGNSFNLSELLDEDNYDLCLSENELDTIAEMESKIVKSEAFWVNELKKKESFNLFYYNNKIDEPERYFSIPFIFPEDISENIYNYPAPTDQFLLASFVLFIARLNQKYKLSVGYYKNEYSNTLFESILPLNLQLNEQNSLSEELPLIIDKCNEIKNKSTYIRDLTYRYGVHNFNRDYAINVGIIDDIRDMVIQGSNLTLLFSKKTSSFFWHYNSAAIKPDQIKKLQSQFVAFLNDTIISISKPLFKMNIVPIEDLEKINILNNTMRTLKETNSVIDIFIKQTLINSNEKALVFGDKEYTYEELGDRVNFIAAKIIELGIMPNDVVGVNTERSDLMLISILAVLRAGAAYLPLDPEYPADRIKYMINDSKTTLIITDKNDSVSREFAQFNIKEKLSSYTKSHPSHPFPNTKPENLCYLIYTSGSTGNPKGVMVKNSNVVNFFEGMDVIMPEKERKNWLAVTSLSFDISVLELLYTLCRGFKVVLYSKKKWQNELKKTQTYKKDIAFSLLYFSGKDTESGSNYDLLLEGAKYADDNGFEAIWTPERHFHNFGGIFPNPSVTSAALAVITKNLKIRAGSVVSPIHHPVRIAEEWAVVDNLSKGRIGISFASGWMPNDFILNKDGFKNRKELMFEQIETVKKLWKGESLEFVNPMGQNVLISTLPRPYKKDLDIWITSAANPETFQMAGERGYNVLTHLLGQSIQELKDKIDIYNNAKRNAGFPEDHGKITLMLHTFVGESDEEVKKIVREPMISYLKTSMDLIKAAAWSFPTFKESTMNKDGQFSLDNLSKEEHDAILEYSFERYYESSGLFGSIDTCNKLIQKVKEIGVDEVACLIDFGIDDKVVLESLHYLTGLRIASNDFFQQAKDDHSVSSLIKKHNINYLQCTPSMAQMFLSEDETKNSLSSLEYLLIGGEAFTSKLAKQLKNTTNATIINMYGPTETTIWSLAYEVTDDIPESIPIGKPLANQSAIILDSMNQLTPIGIPGELCIGGNGVTAGYLNNPQLTALKFIENDLSFDHPVIYKTGDIAAYKEDGNIEFMGRIDNQVKIRGHRIELGEIETMILKFPGINEIVVKTDNIDNDIILTAFYTATQPVDISSLRAFLRKSLPEFMIPEQFNYLKTMPYTPNKKIDRKALKSIAVEKIIDDANILNDSVENIIKSIWIEELNNPGIRLSDNFFDIGGHSLLAVRVHNKISKQFDKKISLVDIFKFPTINTLASFIKGTEISNAEENDELEEETMQRKRIIRNRRITE